MYKLKTQLAFYRFNTSIQHSSQYITWYVLNKPDDIEEYGRCFTYNELTLFQNFVTQNQMNFPGNKNYHPCNDEEAPFCDIYSLRPNQGANSVKNLIIRKNPKLSTAGTFHNCMDIILTNQSHDNHTYNLDFDVIGRIEF